MRSTLSPKGARAEECGDSAPYKCRNSRHGLPARQSVTARMAVPHFGCGSTALYYYSPVSSQPATIFVARASSPSIGHGQDGRATLWLRLYRAVLLFPRFFAARDDFCGTGFQPVNRSRPGWPCHTLVAPLPRCTTIPPFLRGPRRFLWHGLPARQSATARMAVPHFGCGSAVAPGFGDVACWDTRNCLRRLRPGIGTGERPQA